MKSPQLLQYSHSSTGSTSTGSTSTRKRMVAPKQPLHSSAGSTSTRKRMAAPKQPLMLKTPTGHGRKTNGEKVKPCWCVWCNTATRAKLCVCVWCNRVTKAKPCLCGWCNRVTKAKPCLCDWCNRVTKAKPCLCVWCNRVTKAKPCLCGWCNRVTTAKPCLCDWCNRVTKAKPCLCDWCNRVTKAKPCLCDWCNRVTKANLDERKNMFGDLNNEVRVTCPTMTSPFRSVKLSSRWYPCARKSPYALHPVSQKFPQRCPWNTMPAQRGSRAGSRRPARSLSDVTEDELNEALIEDAAEIQHLVPATFRTLGCPERNRKDRNRDTHSLPRTRWHRLNPRRLDT